MELVNQNHDIQNNLSLLLKEYQEKISLMKEISDSQYSRSNVLDYFLQANEIRFSYNNLFDFEKAKKVLNSEMWKKMISLTNILKYMPAEDRNKWEDDIYSNNTPDFTEEIVLPTLKKLFLEQEDFFARKVDGIFRNLSGEHVTNSPSGFSKKMIFSIVNYYGSINSDKTAYIDDLRFVIYKILGREENIERRSYDDFYNMHNNELFGEWFLIDGGSLKVKLFKKGTIHLVADEYVAVKLNQVLATLHPNAIPPKNRKVSSKIKKFELRKNFLSENVQKELKKILDKLRYKNSFYYSHSLKGLDKDNLEEIFQITDALVINNHLSFSYDPTEVFVKMCLEGHIPEKQSHQFYPTEDSLAELAISMIGVDKYDRVLEPSAGSGRLVDKLYNKDRVKCIEISKTHCEVLESKGYAVENLDFMEYPIENKFDKIIMNPPFTGGQAKSHVEKAVKHLNENGKLVAIVPSSLSSLEIEGYNVNSTEVIENAFLESGTKVSVVILRISKEK